MLKFFSGFWLLHPVASSSGFWLAKHSVEAAQWVIKALFAHVSREREILFIDNWIKHLEITNYFILFDVASFMSTG